MIIAIDGPSGAGKSTVAKAVAREARASRAWTRGPMYRAVAWQAHAETAFPLDDDAALGRVDARLRHRASATSRATPCPRRVSIGGVDVTDAIRTAEIDRAVSPVSAAPSVRAALVDQQRRIGRAGDYVVEGRDIGTVVFPEARGEGVPHRIRRGACAPPRAPERRPRRGLRRLRRGARRPPPSRRARLVARHVVRCARPTTPCAWTPPAATSRRSSTRYARCLARAEGAGAANDQRGPRAYEQIRAMSLFLPYEKMWDMPLGGTSAGQAGAALGRQHHLGVFGVRVQDMLPLPGGPPREPARCSRTRSGVLVVANHTSFLDVAFMYLAARPAQWVRFMGRENLFGNAHGLVGQILSRVGAFPVKRDAADRTAIKRATRMLKNNEVVGILPEGTRRGKSDREARDPFWSRVHREDGACAHPAHDRAQRGIREAEGQVLPLPQDHHRVRRSRCW